MKAQFNWFPGHMNKTLKAIEDKVSIVDLVIEIIDARAPLSSQNSTFEKILKNKSHMFVISKSDLADSRVTNGWINFFKNFSEKVNFFIIDYKDRKFTQKLILAIEQATLEKRERQKKRGIVNPLINALVIGIPNVGKSTFINHLVKNKSVKIGNRPGVTRGLQILQLNKNINIIDTPGVLPAKLKNMRVAINICGINSIKSNVYPLEEVAVLLMLYIFNNYQIKIEEFYHIKTNFIKPLTKSDMFHIFELIHRNPRYKNFSIENLMNNFMTDVYDGNLKISLETPQDYEEEIGEIDNNEYE